MTASKNTLSISPCPRIFLARPSKSSCSCGRRKIVMGVLEATRARLHNCSDKSRHRKVYCSSTRLLGPSVVSKRRTLLWLPTFASGTTSLGRQEIQKLPSCLLRQVTQEFAFAVLPVAMSVHSLFQIVSDSCSSQLCNWGLRRITSPGAVIDV